MPASRPASVPSSTSSHQSSQHPANIQPSGPPAKARKRAKQAAGAGTVLLALFSFVVFLGPIGPMAGPSLNALGRSHAPLGPATQMVLPGPGSLMDHPSGGGRVLMSVDGENVTDALPVSNETQLVLPINASFSGQAISLAEGSGDNGVLLEVLQDDGGVVQSGAAGQGWWSGLLDAAHVEPSRSIVLRPSNREAESQALQGLKVVSLILDLQQSSLSRSATSAQTTAGPIIFTLVVGLLFAWHCKGEICVARASAVA